MRAAALAIAALVAGSLAAPAAPATAAGSPGDRLRGAGLEPLAPLPGPPVMVRGELPGSGRLRVVLFAGCGPGGEASRGAALAAAVDLARTPRRHGLELVLCAAGDPGAAAPAATAWLAAHPGPATRRELLAALHLEIGEPAAGRPTGVVVAAAGPDGRRLPPAWLAHAALRGAAAAGGRLAIGEPRRPLLGQLLGRHARSRTANGAQPFLAAGVPALTLAGGAAADWPRLVAGVVRRLDSLAGRPRDDDVYLAAGGRIWSRRDLYWLGLVVWVALIIGGRPGAWRGAGSGARRRRGRRYLPRFLLRMLFLVALLAAPAATLVLLAPAALASLVPLSTGTAAWLGRALAALPAALFLGHWAVALAAGRVAAWPAQPLRLALVLAGVALCGALIGRAGGEDVAPPEPR